MPSSLSLFISSFPLKVRDMRLYLEVLAGLFISLISVSFQRRERKSGERFCSSAVRIHTRTKFLVSRGHSSQGPKTATIKPPVTTDHRPQQQMQLWKALKYCENYQNVTQRREVSGHRRKDGANRLAQSRVVRNLQFVKNAISAKHSKTSYACICNPFLSPCFKKDIFKKPI